MNTPFANGILSGNGVHFYLYDNSFGPDDERLFFKYARHVSTCFAVIPGAYPHTIDQYINYEVDTLPSGSAAVLILEMWLFQLFAPHPIIMLL